MKIFPKLKVGSCWSGAVVTPAAEDAQVRRRTESHATEPSGRSSAAHWKPKLDSISESSSMPDTLVGGGIRQTDDKKRRVRVNSKPQLKIATPASVAQGCDWNHSHTFTLPAFTPTSYLF